MDYKKLYEENKEFQTFVDKASRTYKKTVEETLQMATVHEVGDYYAENRKPVSHETVNINVGCGGGC